MGLGRGPATLGRTPPHPTGTVTHARADSTAGCTSAACLPALRQPDEASVWCQAGRRLPGRGALQPVWHPGGRGVLSWTPPHADCRQPLPSRGLRHRARACWSAAASRGSAAAPGRTPAPNRPPPAGQGLRRGRPCPCTARAGLHQAGPPANLQCSRGLSRRPGGLRECARLEKVHRRHSGTS